MNIEKAHCLFEQSGTWKREFIKLGIPAFDYDIQNEFGETDNIIDLFKEIDKAYERRESLFDTFGKNDLVMAFFPCTRFDSQIQLSLSGNRYGLENWSDIEKLEYSKKLHEEVARFYELVNKLFIVCLRGGGRWLWKIRQQCHIT